MWHPSFPSLWLGTDPRTREEWLGIPQARQLKKAHALRKMTLYMFLPNLDLADDGEEGIKVKGT